jgi:hypothetical protein
MRPEKRLNPERSPDSLEARLRALSQPPIPADLEARLLATIPAEGPIPKPPSPLSAPEGEGRRGRWAVWAGVVGAMAAACLLAFLAWPRRDGKPPVSSPGKTESAHQDTSPPPDASAGIAALLQARRDLVEAETPTFTWPLPEASPIGLSTSIPADLFD